MGNVAAADYTPVARRRTPNRLKDLKNAKFGDRGADLDPELEFVVGKILDSGWTIEAISRETEKMGHKVGSGALIGWIYGGTKRPQNYTITMVMRALGWEKEWSQRA